MKGSVSDSRLEGTKFESHHYPNIHEQSTLLAWLQSHVGVMVNVSAQ